MELSKGEFVDRISILLHKAQKIKEPAYPEFVKFAEELLLEVPEEELLFLIKGIRKTYYDIKGRDKFDDVINNIEKLTNYSKRNNLFLTNNIGVGK